MKINLNSAPCGLFENDFITCLQVYVNTYQTKFERKCCFLHFRKLETGKFSIVGKSFSIKDFKSVFTSLIVKSIGAFQRPGNV